jgi:hypothetical protein
LYKDFKFSKPMNEIIYPSSKCRGFESLLWTYSRFETFFGVNERAFDKTHLAQPFRRERIARYPLE